MNLITSTSNMQVKQLVQLQKKAKERTAQDVFVVEGMKMYQEVPKDRLLHTYVSESLYNKNKALFSEDRQVTVLADRVFEYVSDTKTPQGVLCLVRQYHYAMEDLIKGQALVMVLENLQDPGNLGTIMRTAEGAGVTGVLMSSGCVDLYNPKVIRSTMGSVYRMPFYYTEDLKSSLLWLKEKGVTLYAAHLKGESSYDRQDYRGASGFLIGNESKGLSDETADLADVYVKIPMCGKVESLNAAVASSILMYEVNRQRRNG